MHCFKACIQGAVTRLALVAVETQKCHAMAGLESKPSFRERAIEIGGTEAFIDSLVDCGIDCFGKLAFICSANPHSGDDTPLREAITGLLPAQPSVTEMMVLRRLWFEANAYALADLKAKTDRGMTDSQNAWPA